MDLHWTEPKNWGELGSLRDLLNFRRGVVSFFLFLQGFSVLETPKDAINKDSSPGPFDTFAFEGPGRESSLYVVRINSLYTQTINCSMDLPDPWKAQPCFPGPLRLYSVPYAHQCFGVLFCFLFVILKSPFLRIVRADQHCPQPSIYLHSPANVNQESKSQTEEALNGVIGGRSDFQLSVRGPGLLAGQGIVLSHKPAVCMGSQSRVGAARSGAAPARRRARGWGILGGQTLWLWAGWFPRLLTASGLFNWGSVSLWLPLPWLVVRRDEESHRPEKLSVVKCDNIIIVVDLDILLEKFFQVCLIYFFLIFPNLLFSPGMKSKNLWIGFPPGVLSASPWSRSMLW